MAKRVPHRIENHSEHEVALVFRDEKAAQAFRDFWSDRGAEDFAWFCDHFSDWHGLTEED